MKLHNMHFLDRQKISTKISYGLMEKLFENKLIKKFNTAVLKEDKEGVDYFFSWHDDPETVKKIQFKNRQDKFCDFPICRYQPFYGTDCEKTVVGRDYRALRDGMNDYYFTAIQPDGKTYSTILVIDSKKLFKLVADAEKEWFGDQDPWSYFTAELCDKTKNWNKKLKIASNGVQAWFKRTASEKNPKINIYVPQDYAEQTIKI